jgi:hypothetical protein
LIGYFFFVRGPLPQPLSQGGGELFPPFGGSLNLEVKLGRFLFIEWVERLQRDLHPLNHILRGYRRVTFALQALNPTYSRHSVSSARISPRG